MVHQFYQVRVIDEFVLRGNSATLKCLVPSFITEFVDVEAWVSNEDEEFSQKNQSIGRLVYQNNESIPQSLP